MDCFSGSNSRQIAVPLIREHIFIRQYSSDSCCNRACAAVRSFLHIDIHIIVCKDSAADRCDTDRLVLNTEFVDHFHQDLMDDTMPAAGTIMHRSIGDCLRFFINYFHFIFCHDIFHIAPYTRTRSIIAPTLRSTSSGDGIIPPVRP